MAGKREKQYVSDNVRLMAEWDYEKNNTLNLNPCLIVVSSRQKVWWKCEQGHSWSATIAARARNNNPTGCPFCKGNLPVIGENDFATMFPELLYDWDYEKNAGISPLELTAHSGKYVWWKCHFCGHGWQTRINNRTSNKRGCPNCSLKSTSFGEQALFYYIKQIFPSAVNRFKKYGFELDIFIPEMNLGIEYDGYYYHNSDKSIEREIKKYLQCQSRGIRLIRIVDSRGMHKNTADKIIGIENVHLFKNLNNIIRLVLKELDPASNFWTRTNPNQIWSTIDSKVNVEKDYFDIIKDKRLRAIKHSAFSDHPALLKEWDYSMNKSMNPHSITAGSSIKVWWKCEKCGYQWKARIPDRIRGDGCPCCNRRILIKGVNDFATLHPDELLEWDYDKNKVLPSEVIDYRTKFWWKCCKCGHSWQATIYDKATRTDKTNCPKCAKRIVAEKRHLRAMKSGGLFDIYPELLQEWDYEKNTGIDPFDIARGSNYKYWWICSSCGYSWQVSPNNRSRKHGCPKCRHKIVP